MPHWHCGGWSGTEYFATQVPIEWQNKEGININEIGCFATLTSLKLWGGKLERHKILIRCDNEVTVTVLNSGRTRNKFTNVCLREIAWTAAQENFSYRAVLLPRVKNYLNGLLSRKNDPDCWGKVQQVIKEFKMTE